MNERMNNFHYKVNKITKMEYEKKNEFNNKRKHIYNTKNKRKQILHKHCARNIVRHYWSTMMWYIVWYRTNFNLNQLFLWLTTTKVYRCFQQSWIPHPSRNVSEICEIRNLFIDLVSDTNVIRQTQNILSIKPRLNIIWYNRDTCWINKLAIYLISTSRIFLF